MVSRNLHKVPMPTLWGGQDILILTRSWQDLDNIKIFYLDKVFDNIKIFWYWYWYWIRLYWYWLLNPRQYQDILILKLILNKAFEEYWYWLLSPRQYQDILILKLILYKVLEEYWYCLRNHNQYQDILILFISLERRSCPPLRGAHCEYYLEAWTYLLTLTVICGHLPLETSTFYFMVKGYLVFEG